MNKQISTDLASQYGVPSLCPDHSGFRREGTRAGNALLVQYRCVDRECDHPLGWTFAVGHKEFRFGQGECQDRQVMDTLDRTRLREEATEYENDTAGLIGLAFLGYMVASMIAMACIFSVFDAEVNWRTLTTLAVVLSMSLPIAITVGLWRNHKRPQNVGPQSSNGEPPTETCRSEALA